MYGLATVLSGFEHRVSGLSCHCSNHWTPRSFCLYA